MRLISKNERHLSEVLTVTCNYVLIFLTENTQESEIPWCVVSKPTPHHKLTLA
jgi:hypothetical protein